MRLQTILIVLISLASNGLCIVLLMRYMKKVKDKTFKPIQKQSNEPTPEQPTEPTPEQPTELTPEQPTEPTPEQLTESTPEQLNVPTQRHSVRRLILSMVLGSLLSLGVTVFAHLFYQDVDLFVNVKIACLLPLLWAVAYTDFTLYLIPNQFIIVGLIERVIILAFELFMQHGGQIKWMLISEGVALLAMAIICFVSRLLVKNAIGYGDIKLFIVMSIMLGIEGMGSAAMCFLIIAFFFSVFLLITRKKGKKDVIPFAPAIMAGTYLSVILTGM